jgi:hypothetical protein
MSVTTWRHEKKKKNLGRCTPTLLKFTISKRRSLPFEIALTISRGAESSNVGTPCLSRRCERERNLARQREQRQGLRARGVRLVSTVSGQRRPRAAGPNHSNAYRLSSKGRREGCARRHTNNRSDLRFRVAEKGSPSRIAWKCVDRKHADVDIGGLLMGMGIMK